MRINLLFLILLFSILPAFSVGASNQCLLLGPEDAAEIAIERNPTLSALRREAESVRARIGPAGALPDPQLGIGILNLPMDTFSFDQEAMTQTQIKLTQKIPFPGKLSIKRSIQKLEALRAQWRERAETLKVKAEVKGLWWELFRIKNTFDILLKEEKTLRKIIELTQSRYETGKGLQSDVLLSQLELTRVLKEKIDLEARYHEVEKKLISLMSVSHECIDLKEDIETGLLPLEDQGLLVGEAMNINPTLKEKETLLAIKRRTYDLKKRDLYPDFAITGAYGKRFGENPNGDDRADFGSLLVTMNIPLFFKQKQNQEIISALRAVEALESAIKAEKDNIDGKIGSELSLYNGLLQQDTLYRKTIIPKARATLLALKDSYAAGRADILGLLKAELMLYRFEGDHIGIISNAKKVLSRLEAIVGKDLEGEK
ncbi:Heavy metal RND efflux outer membrane protein, CzcC family [Dissulfuribacter thermophilus]|uniref:Heavy metal RND efflux outer membrane protein, CzcC family n=1 Tax=Dissulfuribacter thermophilus TaxID=1156395 RepID=A0A1B9F7U9_9BACT|nr:TolC family protein [Dissulfuribacter thermophilus]OCC15841.1 Heavy metal RND efflux outer membrane protein, CzcC family [Dissulfuribacter thermophilus]